MARPANTSERLHAAARHLGAMGVETRPTADGDALKGTVFLRDELVLPNPGGGPRIEAVRFTVHDDGHLTIDEPANLCELVGLPKALEVRSVAEISTAFRCAMGRHFSGVRGLRNKLRAFGLRVRSDSGCGDVEAEVDLEGLGIAVLESDGPRLIARRLCARDMEVSLSDLPIDLDTFDDRVELERYLSDVAERLAPRRRG